MAFPGAGILWQIDLSICPIGPAGRYRHPRRLCLHIRHGGCRVRAPIRETGAPRGSIRPHHRRRRDRADTPAGRSKPRRTVHRGREARRRSVGARDRYRGGIEPVQFAGIEHVRDIIARIALPPGLGRARRNSDGALRRSARSSSGGVGRPTAPPPSLREPRLAPTRCLVHPAPPRPAMSLPGCSPGAARRLPSPDLGAAAAGVRAVSVGAGRAAGAAGSAAGRFAAPEGGVGGGARLRKMIEGGSEVLTAPDGLSGVCAAAVPASDTSLLRARDPAQWMLHALTSDQEKTGTAG